VTVTQQGTLSIQIDNSILRVTAQVLPNSSENLLSLIALTDEHGYLLSPNLEYLYHKDRPTTHIKTRRNHGVLTIQGNILPPRKTSMPQALAAISPSQAHSRLGHISQKRIKQAEQHVDGLKVDWVVPDGTTPCISCGQGALARKKISKGPRQRPLATQPRTACTVDFLGPRKISLAGHSYALIFSDLYTGIPASRQTRN